MGKQNRPYRLKVEAEAVFEVTDRSAVEEAALEDIARTTFYSDDMSSDEVVQEEQAAVRGDVEQALSWLADPGRMVAFEVPGLEVRSTSHSVQAVDADSSMADDSARFEGLFRVCHCSEESCDACQSFQLTPRTAVVLRSICGLLADNGYDDVIAHGDDDVESDSDWMLFDQYPRITWREDATWRRQAARALDDLAEDLIEGRWPLPRCPAEEMGLHLAVRYADAAVKDGWAGTDSPWFEDLPEHPDDFDWDMVLEVFFQDHDILLLFTNDLDGIEDPDEETNRAQGIGDYRPSAWFAVFNNMEPRDPRRPFRR